MHADATNQMVSARTSVDGGTGSAEVDEEGHDNTLKLRLVFLVFNTLCVAMTVAVGCMVFRMTNSVAVELDYMVSAADAVALMINVVTELVKSKVTDAKTFLVLDLLGCGGSIALLVFACAYGMCDVIFRSTSDPRHAAHIVHADLMIAYGALNMFVDALLLGIFWCARSYLLASSRIVDDQLNMMSTIAHVVVDLVTAVVLCGTSIWMVYGIHDRTQEEKIEHKLRIDLVGGVLVNACIVTSMIMLGKEALHTWAEIQALRETDAKLAEFKDQFPEESLEAQKEVNYGTMI
eukprot:TRINITY_DN31094_c0_g1_i1.p1 TRINITY_DN31094_c0_g1~~TRINITY_DN31094_c0_g1_i1.p1  ORF type:complete len:292 (+),score=52.44 TRINITY_DN31094_c0_g1_i1:204-1079(+)